MNDELDGSGRGLFEVLSRYLPGEAEENNEKGSRGSRRLGPRFDPIISQMRVQICTVTPTRSVQRTHRTNDRIKAETKIRLVNA
jgi:hypothetical protein